MMTGCKAIAVAVLLCLVQGNAGARHLSQEKAQSSSVSASVSGSPGATGNIQMSFSGDGGSFQQSIPVQGPTSFQFSTDNGGTVSLINPAGPPQVFTSVLGPPGSTPFPQAPPIALPQVQIPQVGAGAPFTLPALDLSPLDPDFATKIRERIQALFDRLRASGSFVPNQPLPMVNPVAGGSPPNPQQVVQQFQQNAQNQLNQVTGQAFGDTASVMRTGPNSVTAYSQSSGPNAKTSLNLSASSTSG